MFGNREISLNFIRLLVHISRVDQRLLMCKHAQFRCHYGSRPGCHRVQGAMTQIYSQRMQDGFFPFGQRRFCIQFVQLILIWKTRFARLYRAFFSVVHWFFEIVSFSWQMCQRRLAIPLFPFPFHIRCVYLYFCDTRYGENIYILIGRCEWSAFVHLISHSYYVLFDPCAKADFVVITFIAHHERQWLSIAYLWPFSWPIISTILKSCHNGTKTQERKKKKTTTKTKLIKFHHCRNT